VTIGGQALLPGQRTHSRPPRVNEEQISKCRLRRGEWIDCPVLCRKRRGETNET
jgi:hypothetical protein